MKTHKSIVKIIYVILFILSCWNWLYIMAVNSDIPAKNPTYKEFIEIESNILVVFFLFIYLSIKGKPLLNISLLFFFSFFWLFMFVNYINFNVHIYYAIISSSMLTVMTIMLLWNIYLVMRNKKKRTNKMT